MVIQSDYSKIKKQSRENLDSGINNPLRAALEPDADFPLLVFQRIFVQPNTNLEKYTYCSY